MFKNRFLLVLGLLSLLLVAMSALEEADRIQQRWAADTARWEAMGEFYANQADAEHKAIPPYIMDSATRSYIAQAKVITCDVDAAYGLDSAARSYIAWANSLDARMLYQ